MMQGTQLIEISDLEFQLKIKGFTTIIDAYGFFVDGPVHSIYYITFPTEGYTRGFDTKTGMSHTRKSEGYDYWRVNGAVKFGTKIICGDSLTGQLWELDGTNKTENGGILRTKIVTPSVSFSQKRNDSVDRNRYGSGTDNRPSGHSIDAGVLLKDWRKDLD